MKLIIAILMATGLAFSAAPKKITLTDRNTVVMNEPFRQSSVSKAQNHLARLSSQTRQDLYLVLNSPGGSISAGQSLIDFAKSLPNKVHTITIFAASMAYLTAQHLDKRYILPSGRMMSHRARISGLGGQVPGEANSRLGHINQIVSEIFQTTAKRVGVPFANYVSMVYDELWLTGYQAVRLNHADQLAEVKCAKSLSGTYNSVVQTFFGSYNVTFSKCPLITGPLKVKSNNQFIKNYINELYDYNQKQEFKLTL